jgi:hypothetical protein
LPNFVPDSLAPESMELVALESKELTADSEELLAPDSLPPGSEPTVPHSNSVTMVPDSLPPGLSYVLDAILFMKIVGHGTVSTRGCILARVAASCTLITGCVLHFASTSSTALLRWP